MSVKESKEARETTDSVLPFIVAIHELARGYAFLVKGHPMPMLARVLWELTVGLPGDLVGSWNYNRFGTKVQHITLGYRFNPGRVGREEQRGVRIPLHRKAHH
ncbi:MAG: hypothetical protein OES47_13080 [Acidobacteriota bacterium]|nr:hypothetical protein [Acidobacteriota bacterium]